MPAVDCLFDCARIAWIVMIACVLVLDLELWRGLMIGVLAGISFSCVSWATRRR